VLNTAAAPVHTQSPTVWQYVTQWLNPVVLFVWGSIFFVISFGIGITIPTVAQGPAWIFHTGWALFLSVNVIFHYFNLLTTDGGSPDAVQYDHTASWCNKCDYPKPYRAHHCSSTGRCVLRMDHFCVFAMKPIGLRNHRHFILFVFFIWLAAGYAVIMSLSICRTIVVDLNEVLYCSFEEVPGGGRHLLCKGKPPAKDWEPRTSEVRNLFVSLARSQSAKYKEEGSKARSSSGNGSGSGSGDLEEKVAMFGPVLDGMWWLVMEWRVTAPIFGEVVHGA
jgi:hypothetical protein